VKFAQLPVGARFHFRERIFSKVSPIEAIDVEFDKRKVIPRSAKVTPTGDGADMSAPTLPEQLRRADVEAALADYSSQLLAKLQRVDPPLNALQNAAIATLVRSLHADCITRLTLHNGGWQQPTTTSDRKSVTSPKK
jgi:hypothetical protein